MGTGPHTPSPPPAPGRLWDKHDLAAYLGLGVCAVQKMITKRDCPRITWIGNNARFDWPDVHAWVEGQKEKPPTVAPAVPALALAPPPRAGRRRAA